MILELRLLLVAFIIGHQMNNLNCLSTDYWLGFKNVIENVLPHSAHKMISTDSKLRCAVSCKSEPHCAAFAFHQQRKECHLYTRNVEELGSDPDPGMDVFMVITDGSNVAILKPPSTGSVGSLQPIPAALDNNPNTCFQTHREDYQPWFLVDLMETFLIRLIVVYNEAVYPERLHDVNYEVYDSDPTVNNSSEGNCCASVVDYNTGKNTIRCNDGVYGRFVKISIGKSNFLTLCGVEIYGIPVNGPSNTSSQTYECKKLPAKILLKVLQYDITSITISNRFDDKHIVGHRMADVSIMVYDTDPRVGNPPSKLCIFIPGVFGCTVRNFECDEKTVGRFIRITDPTEFISMCEVEVTGLKQ